MIVPVILAGGSGTRLWPLSRKHYPKQFLSLTQDGSLLQNTLARIIGNQYASPILVCHEQHRFITAEQVRQSGISNADILLEPCSKNTAPAIALAAFQAQKLGNDPILLVLSADHLIAEKAQFDEAVQAGKALAQQGKIVSLGVPADRPETGYGYIQKGPAIANSKGYEIAQFIEKPTLDSAEAFVKSQMYLFNTGIFMFRASTFLTELLTCSPQTHTYCQQAFLKQQDDLDFIRVDEQAFNQVPSDSIDYAVMEKTKNAAVVPLATHWNDIGSYHALWQELEKDPAGNVFTGDVKAVATNNSLIMADNKLVATLGVDNLVIIDSKDALLVTTQAHTQAVKELAEQLADEQRDEVHTHREVYRPWGKYDTLDQGDKFLVKRVTVKPGEQLSLQKHHHRAEHWVVVEIGRASCRERVCMFV